MSNPFTINISAATDIIGCDNYENQDDFFVLEINNVTFICVLDGHGRPFGKKAAMFVKNELISYLTDELNPKIDEFKLNFLTNPKEYLIRANMIVDKKLRDEFCMILNIDKNDIYSNKWLNSPGTTCTLIALHGTDLYVSNVGDSDAILTGLGRLPLDPSIDASLDAGLDASLDAGLDTGIGRLLLNESNIDTSILSGGRPRPAPALKLTANHSPESISEFYRIREYRCLDTDSNLPVMDFIYKSADSYKIANSRNRCFLVDSNGIASVTKNGFFYKNVKNEWASAVVYENGLAFTRSFGDFNLKQVGVTAYPDVVCYKLDPTQNQSIIVASDGVWDNLDYDDVALQIQELQEQNLLLQQKYF